MDTPETIMRVFGAQLRAEAGYKHMPIKVLAEKAGTDRKTLIWYLDGKRAIPMPVYYRVCAALDLNPVDVMRRIEERLDLERANPTP